MLDQFQWPNQPVHVCAYQWRWRELLERNEAEKRRERMNGYQSFVLHVLGLIETFPNNLQWKNIFYVQNKRKERERERVEWGHNLTSLASSVDCRCEEFGERICVCDQNQKQVEYHLTIAKTLLKWNDWILLLPLSPIFSFAIRLRTSTWSAPCSHSQIRVQKSTYIPCNTSWIEYKSLGLCMELEYAETKMLVQCALLVQVLPEPHSLLCNFYSTPHLAGFVQE